MSYYHTQEKHSQLINKFNNSENIVTNFSQAFQDMFVLSMLDGKTNGTFLDIGCHDTSFHNNTYLLEKDYNWKGFGIDLNYGILNKYKTERKAEAVCSDAVTYDYSDILNRLGKIDYLSLDIDPPHQSLRALHKLFSYGVQFDVITFEHDAYVAGDEVRTASRKFLLDQGYNLVVPNACTHVGQYYEDWWCHSSVDLKNKFTLCKNLEKNMPLEFFYAKTFSL